MEFLTHRLRYRRRRMLRSVNFQAHSRKKKFFVQSQSTTTKNKKDAEQMKVRGKEVFL